MKKRSETARGKRGCFIWELDEGVFFGISESQSQSRFARRIGSPLPFSKGEEGGEGFGWAEISIANLNRKQTGWFGI